MTLRNSAIVALAGSAWKLVSAWWKVDRIRVPDSRTADGDRLKFEERLDEVDTARVRRSLANSQNL